ncbi:MAG: hypothetical protein PHE49_02605 [bacterium]|nr:hypothetical protein [bacterium]
MKNKIFIGLMLISLPVFFNKSCLAQEEPKSNNDVWTESFNLEKLAFFSVGRNEYFILEPGYQLVLKGNEGKNVVEVISTVLNETRKIGNIETRIVEERETANGKLRELTRNFYAISKETNSLFYFGEAVENYKNGKLISRSGSWVADSGNAKAGLAIPGIILLGAKYYEEMAPDVAMDRRQILSNTETLQTPAGNFENCLKIKDTTPLEPEVTEYKTYAPGIGMISDGVLLLTKYGFVKPDSK